MYKSTDDKNSIVQSLKSKQPDFNLNNKFSVVFVCNLVHHFLYRRYSERWPMSWK